MALDYDLGEFYSCPSNVAYDTINSMTLSVWANWSGVFGLPGLPSANLINRDNFVAPLNGLFWAINGIGAPAPNLALWGGGAPGPGFMASDIVVPVGVYTHLVTTWDGVTCQHYIDGVAATPVVPAAPAIVDHIAPLIVGSRTDFPVLLGYDGTFDDFRMYNRPLPADEVETIFATRGNDGIVDGLVARFTMREKSVGSTATGPDIIRDVSPVQNDSSSITGTLTYLDSELRFSKRFK